MKYRKLEIPFTNKNYRKQLELINFLEREEIKYIIAKDKVDTIIIFMDDIIFRGQRITCVLTSMINTINEKIIYDYNKYDPLLCFGISREYFVFVGSDKNEFYVNGEVLNFYLSEPRPSNSEDILIRPLYSKNNSTDYFYRVGALNTNILNPKTANSKIVAGNAIPLLFSIQATIILKMADIQVKTKITLYFLPFSNNINYTQNFSVVIFKSNTFPSAESLS